jgi:hypothetical protein
MRSRRLFPRQTYRAMSSPLDYDPEHWRRRADEMRRIADGLNLLPSAQASVLRTAEEYCRLAVKAEERLCFATSQSQS